MTDVDTAAIRTYYETKTDALLRKYGPGPVVHYHIGLFEEDTVTTAVDEDTLRASIARAQQALVDRAATEWEAQTTLSGEIIDLGCGLGGGSIHWARLTGARVTAVTLADAHIPLIHRFAAESGVSDRVTPLLADAADLPSHLLVDAAVAMESMCYMRRDKVFAGLGKIVRPGGWLCIQDVFLVDPKVRADFDHYWQTRIGTLNEYTSLGEGAGFHLDRNCNVTPATTQFWVHSLAWNEAQLRQLECGQTDGAHPEERDRLVASIRWHALFLRAWLDGGVEVRLLRFRKA